mmetsp:Transcript_62812/g.137585  ORF Transcript_62812/g.137585 Transcript_62812/m.137585 type:complete len:294 (+) Transcript_62812:1065-1946(+)
MRQGLLGKSFHQQSDQHGLRNFFDTWRLRLLTLLAVLAVFARAARVAAKTTGIVAGSFLRAGKDIEGSLHLLKLLVRSSFVRVGLQGHLPVGFDDLGQGGHIGDAQLGVVTLVALSSLLASATSRGRGSFRPRCRTGQCGGRGLEEALQPRLLRPRVATGVLGPGVWSALHFAHRFRWRFSSRSWSCCWAFHSRLGVLHHLLDDLVACRSVDRTSVALEGHPLDPVSEALRRQTQHLALQLLEGLYTTFFVAVHVGQFHEFGDPFCLPERLQSLLLRVRCSCAARSAVFSGRL